MSLRKQTIHALNWTLIERFSTQFVQFGVSIILARLLEPADYGLVGMITIILLIGQQLINSGFGQALIQKKDSTQTDATSVFYFSVAVGLFLVVLLYFIAPLIADFYNEPKLVSLTRIISLNLLINSFMIVHSNLLIKHLNFKTKVLSNLISLPFSAGIGIWMALHGYGVWSLVVQAIVSNLSKTIMIWILFPWRPSLSFSMDSLKKLFSFGSRIMMAGLLSVIFTNIYLVVIGKVYNKVSLGLYSRAQKLQNLTAVVLTQVVGQVAFPVFSSIQNDSERLLRGGRTAIILCSFVIFPVLITMTITAYPLIGVVYGDNWLPTVPYLRILLITGLFYPLSYINVNILKAIGQSGTFLKLEIFKRSLQIINIVITCRYGVLYMLVGNSIATLLGYLLDVHLLNKFFAFPLRLQLKDVLPYLTMSIAAGITAIFIQLTFKSLLLPVSLILQLFFATIVYTSLSYIFKPKAFREVVLILKQHDIGPRLKKLFSKTIN